ncbi:hypothetical protein M0R45_026910 [Rubus argutus]|uniref:Uncharacterized protein n=1 Tax=Rubus argutus TaxID=59490 RepID=A0AAW1WZJ3_RUBAR
MEEPMWEMGIESPLAVLTWSLPWYSVAMERLLRSLVMWKEGVWKKKRKKEERRKKKEERKEKKEKKRKKKKKNKKKKKKKKKDKT